MKHILAFLALVFLPGLAVAQPSIAPAGPTTPISVASGTIARTLAALFSDVANVKMFAPLGGAAICTNNATTDTAAFNAAFASLPATGGVVYPPSCGNGQIYQLNAGLSWANKPIVVKGDGPGVSQINCDMSAACLSISQNTGVNLTAVEDISFYAGHGPGPTSAGVSISYPGGNISPYQTEYIRNVTFIDNTGGANSAHSDTFTTGLSLTGPGTTATSGLFQHWYPVIDNVVRYCAALTSTGHPIPGESGITVGSFIGATVNNLVTNNCDSAVYETDYAQGLYIHAVQSTGGNTGIGFGTYTQSAGQNLQWLVIDGASVIAVTGTSPALALVNVWQGDIEHTQLAVTAGSIPVLSMLDSPEMQVHDNFILGTGLTAGGTGVAISSSSGYANFDNVHDNTITLVQTTASLGSGTTYNAFHDNIPGNSSDPQLYTNAGTNNSISYVKNGATTFSSGPHSFGTSSSVPVHLATAQTTAPALTSCGTSPAIVGTDTAGQVTMGTSATGCVITFNVAYTTAPYCNVTWLATPLASQSYAVSTTAITLTQTSTSGNKAMYNCIAPSGG